MKVLIGVWLYFSVLKGSQWFSKSGFSSVVFVFDGFRAVGRSRNSKSPGNVEAVWRYGVDFLLSNSCAIPALKLASTASKTVFVVSESF